MSGFRTSAGLCGRIACMLCVWAVAASPVHAADGRIVFAGAVSAPTCAVTASNLQNAVSQAPNGAVKGTCASNNVQKTLEPRNYELTIAAMPASMVDPRVGVYFQGYATTSTSHELLATQTYE